MPSDSALVTVKLLPSNFPNKLAFVRAVINEARTQAEQIWKNQPAPICQRRGRPSKQDSTEDVIAETINERFYAAVRIVRMRAKAKEKRKALEELGVLSQGKLANTVREKLEARNQKDGLILAPTPHEDTILKYVKGDKLFNRTDPHKLTVDQAHWLAKHQPSRAKSILHLARIWTRHQIPEQILTALSTTKVSPPKK
jgi:hypothetical protein